MTTKNSQRPFWAETTEGRARPREDAPRLVLGALWFRSSHRCSAGNGCKCALPGGGRARPSGAARLDSGPKGACDWRSVLPVPRRRARAFEPENGPLDRFPPPRGGSVLTPAALRALAPGQGVIAAGGPSCPARANLRGMGFRCATLRGQNRAKTGLSLPSVRGSADPRTSCQPQKKSGRQCSRPD